MTLLERLLAVREQAHQPPPPTRFRATKYTSCRRCGAEFQEHWAFDAMGFGLLLCLDCLTPGSGKIGWGLYPWPRERR